jgi:hypothetical protein
MTTYAVLRSISPQKYGVGAQADFPISLTKWNIIVNLKEPHPNRFEHARGALAKWTVLFRFPDADHRTREAADLILIPLLHEVDLLSQ